MRLKKLLNPFYVYERRALIKPALKGTWARYSESVHHWPGNVSQWLRAQGIPVTENDRRVAALKDKHRGRRCFILGNGPSLKIEDLERLKNEVTFASNKIYLAFDQTQWRPTYYSLADVLVAENNHDIIAGLPLNKIFCESVRGFFKSGNDVIWLRELETPLINGSYECRFSTNIVNGVYGGWTVIYHQMQLAFYMGIREIYLIGVDFKFNVPVPTGEVSMLGEVLLESQGEINHFHPEYRKPGEIWTMPMLGLQYKAFLAAKKTVEAYGGNILNASRKTALDVFPCIDFDTIISCGAD